MYRLNTYTHAANAHSPPWHRFLLPAGCYPPELPLGLEACLLRFQEMSVMPSSLWVLVPPQGTAAVKRKKVSSARCPVVSGSVLTHKSARSWALLGPNALALSLPWADRGFGCRQSLSRVMSGKITTSHTCLLSVCPFRKGTHTQQCCSDGSDDTEKKNCFFYWWGQLMKRMRRD